MEKVSYESVWIPIRNVTSTEVSLFEKSDIHFRKHIDICFLIGELVFVTTSVVDNEIIICIPELCLKFAKCENTLLALKNSETHVMVYVSIESGRILLRGFPFEPSTRYELSLQFFMRITN